MKGCKVGNSIMSTEQQFDALKAQARRAVDLHVEGRTQWDAYRGAGYKGKIEQAASSFFKRYRWAVDYRKELLSKDSEKRRQRSIERVEGYTKANLADVFTEGLEMTDEQWKALPREVKRLVSEISVDTEKGRVKVKLEPRMQAEARLARLEGYDRPFTIKDETPGASGLTARLIATISAPGAEEEVSALLSAAAGESDTDP